MNRSEDFKQKQRENKECNLFIRHPLPCKYRHGPLKLTYVLNFLR